MFGNLLKAVIGVVTAPLDVVADVVTLGGLVTDRDEPYTATKARQVMTNLDRALDPDEK